MTIQHEAHTVDGTPALIAVPEAARRTGALAMWVPYLGGTKEVYASVLDDLARAGFVAISIDPRRHGQRADVPVADLFAAVMGRFRETMWPILGGTVLDALTVIDWAIERYALGGDVVAGGVSMGGDIAVALGGVDPRIRRVAAVAGTPDWKRPGMTLVDDPETVIAQGIPAAAGAWWYRQLDPITHSGGYDRALAVRFDVGAADTHVPGEAAHRFAQELAGSAVSVQVIDHPGLDHLGTTRNATITADAVAWLIDSAP